MTEVESVLAIRKIVDIQILLDVQSLFKLTVTTDSVVKPICMFAHKPENPSLLAVGCNTVNLEEALVDRFHHLLVLIQVNVFLFISFTFPFLCILFPLFDKSLHLILL
jgi:hypothetical protein